jgi:hypothetical protein
MDGTTGIVVSSIIGLIAIISFAGNFITKQTKLSVQLCQVLKEIEELKILIKEQTNKFETLEKRVFILENKKGGNRNG